MWSRKVYLLLLVSVDGQGRPSILPEVFGDIVGNTLSTDEDEDLGILLTNLIKVLDELRPLLEVADDLNDLLNVVVRGEFHRANVNLDEILQEVL